jgi:hypothetical protein
MGLLMSTDPLLLCCITVMGQPLPSLLYDHYSDEIVAMSHLPVTTVGYGPLVHSVFS